jgi:hypothetical protein
LREGEILGCSGCLGRLRRGGARDLGRRPGGRRGLVGGAPGSDPADLRGSGWWPRIGATRSARSFVANIAGRLARLNRSASSTRRLAARPTCVRLRQGALIDAAGLRRQPAKLQVARWLRPVFCCWSSTRGVDVGARAESRCGVSVAGEAAIVLVSSETRELVEVCDRCWLLRRRCGVSLRGGHGAAAGV